MSNKDLKFETRAIHDGQPPDPQTGAVVPPISLSTTFRQHAVGEHDGFEYSRSGNPTRQALEASIASLEGADFGLAYASGLAAEDNILRMLAPGDHVVLGNDAYGGTYRLIANVHEPIGLSWSAADLTELSSVKAAMTPQTKMIWVETPTNPLLRIVDIAGLAAIARDHGALLVIDNTFATPYLQRPMALGADIVIHSSTKYLGGHSDVVGGAVVLNDEAMYERMLYLQNAAGAIPSPFDCYLLLRGLKTLAIRMDRHSENAAYLANELAKHPKVNEVLYPFLESHQNFDVAKKQMSAGGGMISFMVDGGVAAKIVVESTKIFVLAESLGAVESLIEVPAAMTHASAAGSALEVSDSLVRLSVGIENKEDLWADLLYALDQV